MAPPPFIGALPFDGEGIEKVVDEVENPANPVVLSQFPPGNAEGTLRHIEKERHQAIVLAFRALCNSGRVKGRHEAASVRPLRHPS